MAVPAEPQERSQIPPVLFTFLPGPERKRAESRYAYRLLYRSHKPADPGCLMVWEVSGGRLTYQIALEAAADGRLHLHCTCADYIFRAEPEGRFCKHLRGLLQFGRPSGESVDSLQPRSALGA